MAVLRAKHRARKSSGPWKCETAIVRFCGAVSLQGRDTCGLCAWRTLPWKYHSSAVASQLDLVRNKFYGSSNSFTLKKNSLVILEIFKPRNAYNPHTHTEPVRQLQIL